MQDQYAGDIGDFVKYALLRRLSEGKRLGVAWYLFPDESSKGDGRHIDYLDRPHREKWRPLDEPLFDAMKTLVCEKRRSTTAIEQSGVLEDAVFAGERLETQLTGKRRREWRRQWFENTVETLDGCDLVFADPDNGLCEDDRFSPGTKKHWKRLPLHEVQKVAEEGRTAIVYHHNTRRKGGHRQEIAYWMGQLPDCRAALRWRGWSNRTFFIVNPDNGVEERLRAFHGDWQRTKKIELIWNGANS